jgi:hypothetical protein
MCLGLDDSNLSSLREDSDKERDIDMEATEDGFTSRSTRTGRAGPSRKTSSSSVLGVKGLIADPPTWPRGDEGPRPYSELPLGG